MAQVTIDISQLNAPEVLQDFGPLGYEAQPLTHRVWRGVVINRAGLCMQGLRLLRDCVYDYEHRNAGFWWRGALSRLARPTHRLPLGRRYAVVHSVWGGGYFHWMTEALPRLAVLKQVDPEAVLLLPSHTGLTAVQRASAAALGWPQAEPMPVSDNLFAPELSLVRQPPKKGEYDPRPILAVRETLRARYAEPGAATRRIYISRRSARGRRLANEAEVTDLLTARGFEAVEAEQLSFDEQARLFANAQTLVSVHGAGLTNMLFMAPGGGVIELMKRRAPGQDYAPLRRTDRLNPSYARLAAVLGLDYVAQPCEPAGGVGALADLTADVALLRQALDRLGGSRRA